MLTPVRNGQRSLKNFRQPLLSIFKGEMNSQKESCCPMGSQLQNKRIVAPHMRYTVYSSETLRIHAPTKRKQIFDTQSLITPQRCQYTCLVIFVAQTE